MHRSLVKSPDSPILQRKDSYEEARAGAAQVSHEAGPVGRVGEVLWVDGDGDVVHRQNDYERYPHGPRQGSVYDLKWNMLLVMNSKSHVESPIM